MDSELDLANELLQRVCCSCSSSMSFARQITPSEHRQAQTTDYSKKVAADKLLTIGLEIDMTEARAANPNALKAALAVKKKPEALQPVVPSEMKEDLLVIAGYFCRRMKLHPLVKQVMYC